MSGDPQLQCHLEIQQTVPWNSWPYYWPLVTPTKLNSLVWNSWVFQLKRDISTSWGSKLVFYIPFNSQGHIGAGLQPCHLWQINPHRGDILWLDTKLANHLPTVDLKSTRWLLFSVNYRHTSTLGKASGFECFPTLNIKYQQNIATSC